MWCAVNWLHKPGMEVGFINIINTIQRKLKRYIKLKLKVATQGPLSR